MARESAYFKVNNLHDKHDLKKIKAGLDRLPGVSSVSINIATDSVAVDYDTTGASRDSIRSALQSLGCFPL